MKIGILIDPGANPNEFMEYSQLIEDLGFHSIWCGEPPTMTDGTIVATLISRATKRVKIGFTITNPYLRHPAKTASSFAMLNMLSNNRFMGGIGAGSLEGLRSLNLSWDRAERHCREAIEVISKVLKGKRVDYQGETVTLKGYQMYYPPQKIPLYVGCRRPLMIQMAGEIADGVALDNVPVEYIPYAKQQLEKGATRLNRDLVNFDFANITSFAVAKKGDEARDRIRHFIPIDFITISKRELHSVGLTSEDIKPIQDALNRQTLDRMKAAGSLVNDYMVDKFAIAGTPDECVNRIRSYEKEGISTIILCVPIGPEYKPKETLELAAERILPHIKN